MKQTTPSAARLCVLLLFASVPTLSALGAPQSRYTDDERRPNWVRSTYQFGLWGTEPGKLVEPWALAVGPDNRIHVADTGNHRVQVYSIEGKLLGGWGRKGSGPSEFLFPAGICIGAEGEVFVADTGNDRIQVFDGTGKFLRQWGRNGVAPGEFSAPRGIASVGGRVAVAERDLPRVQVFTTKGEPVCAFGDAGDPPGRIREPAGLALDEQGNIYVADAGNHRVQKFDPQGRPVLQWGTWGSHEGLLANPAGLAYFDGKIFVADHANHRVQVFDRAGTFLYQWGRAPAFAHEGGGRLHFPSGIAVSPSGGFTVLSEPFEHRVQVFSNGSARSVKPVSDPPWWDSMHARFHAMLKAPSTPQGGKPTALTAILEPDTHGILYFDLAPKIPLFVARAGGYGRRLGEFDTPAGLALDPQTGRLHVSDRGNRRIQLLELPRNPATTTGFAPNVRIIASWDLAALLPASPTGIRVERCAPGALALGSQGELFVIDEGNSAVHVFDREKKWIRSIRAPEAAGPSRFVDLALSPDDKMLYVVDRHAGRLLVFDSRGAFQSSWGGEALEGGGSAWSSPSGIAVDGDSSVYVTDSSSQQVLKFDGRGKFLSKWGEHGREVTQFYSPRGITFVKPDRIVVDDVGNHRGLIFSKEGKIIEVFFKGGFLPASPPPK
jgi:DNA-binding beta-propeller fold protein YncE